MEQFLYSAIMVRDAALNLSSRAGVEIVDKVGSFLWKGSASAEFFAVAGEYRC